MGHVIGHMVHQAIRLQSAYGSLRRSGMKSGKCVGVNFMNEIVKLSHGEGLYAGLGEFSEEVATNQDILQPKWHVGNPRVGWNCQSRGAMPRPGDQ